MIPKLSSEAKGIALRNLVVAGIFVFLAVSTLAGYKVNFPLAMALILAAWFISPVAKTLRYLYSRLMKKWPPK